MALDRPIGNIPGLSRSREAQAADLKRLVHIQKFLPDELVRPAVTKFYETHARECLEQALGDPCEIIRQLHPENGKLVEAVEQEISASIAEPEPRLVEEEVRTARQELVRYWVDSLMTAWDTFDRASIVLDDGTLLPDKPLRADPDHERWNSWNEQRREAVDSLLTSIAVRRDDMLDLTRGFASNVKTELGRCGRLELPDQLNVRLRAPRLVLEMRA